MEENLNNNLINEVDETVVELTNSIVDYKKCAIAGAVVGTTALLGTILYKKVVKPKLLARRDAKSREKEVDVTEETEED